VRVSVCLCVYRVAGGVGVCFGLVVFNDDECPLSSFWFLENSLVGVVGRRGSLFVVEILVLSVLCKRCVLVSDHRDILRYSIEARQTNFSIEQRLWFTVELVKKSSILSNIILVVHFHVLFFKETKNDVKAQHQ
jgi:hypothetical protein